MGLRTIFWFCSTVMACLIITHYANKVKANPEKSFVYGIDTTGLGFTTAFSDCKITKRHVGVLLCLAGIFGFTVVGCIKWGWYLDEMTAVFIVGGIIAGFVAGFNVEKITDCFVKGATNLVFGAMCVGVARGIQVILENGHIDALVLHTVRILESEFRNPSLKRHLASLETYLVRVTRTGLGSLVTAGRCSAVSRTFAASDPLLSSFRTWCWFQIM